jgi:hypothetical protein
LQKKLIDRARVYATQAHARIGHRRKYTLDPYDVHLKDVADLVASVSSDEEMIAAAWLHDIVEDTPATFEDIERIFGHNVKELVVDLTDVSRPGHGNRAFRKEMDLHHLANASARAKTIKLADIIDNTSDISKHDHKFAKVYLLEMAALLEVLGEGNEKLLAKAQKTVRSCAERLRMVLPVVGKEAKLEFTGVKSVHPLLQRRGMKIFTEAFSARDIIEPLLSFDQGASFEELASIITRERITVIGLRREGAVFGYYLSEDLHGAHLPQVRSINPRQVVELGESFFDVIYILTFFSICFVKLEGVIVGQISRSDIEKPQVRMWLFGMIILIEMIVVEFIRGHWPDQSWALLVNTGRLEKASQLYQERERRNMKSDLLDCLQFSDKIQILLKNSEFFREAGFPSLASAKKAAKELELLRNNLAHGQEISKHDWAAIVRLTERIRFMKEAAGK